MLGERKPRGKASKNKTDGPVKVEKQKNKRAKKSKEPAVPKKDRTRNDTGPEALSPITKTAKWKIDISRFFNLPAYGWLVLKYTLYHFSVTLIHHAI